MAVTLVKLADNSPRPTVPCTFNTPCPSAGHVVTSNDHTTPDYSDGYGGTYAKGE
jgi:hypothetical protein